MAGALDKPFRLAWSDVGDRAASAARTAFVLHGIFGSRGNWRSFARHLAERLPRWRFVLVDLRGHGDSWGAPPPHDLEACARDLDACVDAVGSAPRVVCGHSFGAKVALTWARDTPHPVEAIWLLDANPGRRDPDDPVVRDVEHVLSTLERIPMPLDSREDLAERLAAAGLSPALIAWMDTNLKPIGRRGRYAWKLELDTVRALLDAHAAADLWPLVEDPPKGAAVHLVRAARSGHWERPATARRVTALEQASGARLHVHTLPGAGHWLHVDAPDALLELMAGELTRAGG